MRIKRAPCCPRLGRQITKICNRLRLPLSKTSARGAILIFLATLCWTGCAKKQMAIAAAPEVEVTPVVQQDVPTYTECIATLDGYVNAQIQPQVTGYLMKQNYTEGTVVHKGDVLFEIDPRPFEAALQQSKGQLAQVTRRNSARRSSTWHETPRWPERVPFHKHNWIMTFRPTRLPKQW